MKKIYVQVYEVIWSEATRIDTKVWCSREFQRIFFSLKTAEEFKAKLLAEGLNPQYVSLKAHELLVLTGEDNA